MRIVSSENSAFVKKLFDLFPKDTQYGHELLVNPDYKGYFRNNMQYKDIVKQTDLYF